MLTTLVELTPSVKERRYVSLLQREHLKSRLDLVDVLEFFVDDRNEDVQEDKEGQQLEDHPVDVSDCTFFNDAVMHDVVPTFTC